MKNTLIFLFAIAVTWFVDADEQSLSEQLSSFVKSKNMPGMVVMIEHGEKVIFHQTVGYSSIEQQTPMKLNDKFRWFSMSKPVTALAMLKTLSDKSVSVDADIKALYPQFDVSESISFQHLLTHTAGFGYGGEWGSFTGLMYWLLDPIEKSSSLGEMMSKLDGIPLHNEPGKAFKYGLASDVQGAIIQHANGHRLDQYMAINVFKPLKMEAVKFVLKGQPDPDLVPFYRYDRETKQSVLVEDASEWDKPLMAGGSGLSGTAEDYMKFLRVLRSPEQYDYLMPSELIAEITRNQLPDSIQKIPERIYSNTGFGYGVGVKLKDEQYLSKGSFYWAGLAGSIFWVDPKHELSVVVMVQELGARRSMEKHLIPMIYEWFYHL